MIGLFALIFLGAFLAVAPPALLAAVQCPEMFRARPAQRRGIDWTRTARGTWAVTPQCA